MKVILIECMVAIILFALSIQTMGKADTVTSVMDTCFITAFFSTLLLCWDLFYKLIYLLRHYIDLNYTNADFRYTISSIFETELSALIYGIVCVVLCIVLVTLHRDDLLRHLWSFNPRSTLICISLAVHLFSAIYCNRLRSSITSSASPNNTQALDYGTGMAYSYYYGYLRIILPSTGTTTKGFLEKLENIEDAHNIKFAINKMLILVPSSTYIPPDLKEASQQWMESAIKFEEETRDRAGTKSRSYSNSVYKIYPGGRGSGFDPIYIAAEGATPLLTYYEVQKHTHPESDIYRKYKQQFVQNFYNKLKELINNDPECRDICEIIYYNDYTNEGRVNVAEVILQRISEIRNTTHR